MKKDETAAAAAARMLRNVMVQEYISERMQERQQHPRCRCSAAVYEDGEDYEAWLDFFSKGGTAKEWNKLKKTRKSVAKDSGSGIINALSTKEDVQVHSVGRINRDIYKCITRFPSP